MITGRLASELAPSPGRWRRAARTASVTAGGAALMAVLQINNPLGLTLLYNFGAPETAFSFAAGCGLLICTSILQWLALALGGSLLTWPLAHLGTFIVLSIVTSYFIYASPHLGRLWVWAQIPILTGFYLMVLQPGMLAADNAEAFFGLAIAAGLLWLCNRVLWPCPPALTLRESTSAMMDEARARLHRLIGAANVHPLEPEGSESPMAPRLGYHLTLLNSAMKQAATLTEAAELLSRVITAERVRHKIGHLEDAFAARGEQDFPTGLAMELAKIEPVFGRLLQEHPASAMAFQAREAESNLATTAALAERIHGLADAHPSMTEILQRLIGLAHILANDPSARLPPGMRRPSIPPSPNPVVRRFLLRFSLRHTLALTIAFLIGLWDNSPALHAAIWLLMLGGPPSHGATARKFTVRAIGSGAALSLAAVATIILAPNFGSLPGYAMAIFIGTLPLAYIGESGGILSYLAIGGTAFVIAFSGPGPRPEMIGSISTIWGITLGMIIRAVLSALWREIPGRTLAEQFQSPIEALLTLTSDEAGVRDGERPAACCAELIEGMARILAVAQDAELEGNGAEIVPEALIAVLDLIGRSGFLLANSQLTMQAHPDSAIEAKPVLAKLHQLYSSWLSHLADLTASKIKHSAPLRAMIAAAGGPHRMIGELERDGRVSGTDLHAKPGHLSAMIPRLLDLTNELEREFMQVARDPEAA